jgi:hypothetical protein
VKIGLNLARPPSHLERYSALGAPVLILVTLALLARILVSAWGGFVEFRKVHRSVLRYQAETTELQRQETQALSLLHRPPTLQLYRQISFLNSLIEQKKLSLSDLAWRVAKLLPSQTRLQSLALTDLEEMPVVQFSVEGEQDGVYAFLGNLEGSSDFGRPTNLSESIEQQGAEKGLVVLRCSAQYVGTNQPSGEEKLRQP